MSVTRRGRGGRSGEWWLAASRYGCEVSEVGSVVEEATSRKQDKGGRDSQKSLRILRNPTEYPSCGGGILRQQARRPAAPMRAGFDADSELVARADGLLGRRSPRSRLGVICAESSSANLFAGGAPNGARWRSTCRGSAAHAAPRCAVDRSGRNPFRKDLDTHTADPLQGTSPPKVGQLASCSAGTGVKSRGPLWPTRIEMGQGFVNDSSRLQKNGPPLSCFRIIPLGASPPASSRSHGPPSAAVQMQRSSARADGCVRSAEEGGPPAPQSLPVFGSCDDLAARAVSVCVCGSAHARGRGALPTRSQPWAL